MFNPRVHDSVAHIANVTGINLMLEQADQDVGAVTDKLGSKARAKPNEYLSCLYDGVTAKSLDKGEFIYRIGRTNLGHFVEAARFVRTSIKRDQHANLALRELIDQAQQYIRLLNGEVDSIKRSDTRGVRHTLRVTEGGRTLYEMLNSMNNEECQLFFNKNRRLLHTAMTDKIVSKNGEMQLKYQLGEGGFGKVRVAWNAMKRCHVAVKKNHPTVQKNGDVEVAMNALPALSERFAPKDLSDLAELADYIVTPTESVRQKSKISEFRQHLNAVQLTELDRDFLGSTCYGTSARSSDADKTHSILRHYLSKPLDTRYEFSPLGFATVEQIVDELNVLRFCLDAMDNTDLLDINDGNENVPSNLFESAISESEWETIKTCFSSPESSRRFINTLAEKMLTALAKLNDIGFHHGDIKPDNIVLMRADDGSIAVKLIDFDMAKRARTSTPRELPEMGHKVFMAPEGIKKEKDKSVSYVGVKADAFAMGLTLKRLLGRSFVDVAELSMARRGQALKPTKEADCKIVNAKSKLPRQLQSLARVRIAPRTIDLEEIADNMIHEHPGKRVTAAEMLNWDFFDPSSKHFDASNFMSEAQFKDHVDMLMLAMCRAPVGRWSECFEQKGNLLEYMRKHADRAVAKHKAQTHATAHVSSIRLAGQEMRLQIAAGLRRIGRAVEQGLDPCPPASIADSKLAYPPRKFIAY